MQLYITSPATPIQSTIGKLETISISVSSDQLLIGKLIRVNPALYHSSFDIGDPLNVDYQLVYPASGSDLVFDQPANNHINYSLKLTVIDGYTFELEYTFFVVADSTTYLSDSVSVNKDPFTTSAISGFVHLRIEVGEEKSFVNFLNPISANGINQNLGIEVGATQPIDSLLVELSGGEGIENNYEVVWYRTDQASGNTDIVDDLGISYGLVASSVSPASDEVDDTAFLSGKGFVSGLASFNIDNNYLVTGGLYRAVIIYREDNQWKSALSNTIEAGKVSVQTLADITSTITDEMSNTTTDMSATKLSDAVLLDICVDIDKASYDANLLTNGIGGTWDDFISSVKIYGNTTGNAGGLGVGAVITETAGTYQLCVNNFLPPTGYIGTYYFVTEIIFDYGGYRDKQLYVIELVYFPNMIEEAVEEEICAETGGEFTATVTNGENGCALKESVNGSSPAEGTVAVGATATSVTIDTDEISIGDEVCVFAICGSTESEDISDCECVECDIRAVFISGTQVSPNNWSVDFTVNSGIITVNNQTSGTNTVTVAYEVLLGFFAFVINVEDNGCLYRRSTTLPAVTGSNPPDFDVSEQMYPLTSSEAECDCDEVDPTCENDIFFEVECDPDTKTIVIAEVEDFGSTPLIDESLMTLDGINWIPLSSPIVGEEEVTIQRTVSFVGGCPEIKAVQTINCNETLLCQNSRSITWSTSPTTNLLTITLTDSFTSTPATDILEVSIDGGLNFEEFDLLGAGYVKIDMNGAEEVIIQTRTQFEDGCGDLVLVRMGGITDHIPKSGSCDYSGYSIEADYSGGEFTATFNGSEGLLVTNRKLFLINGGDPLSEDCCGIRYEGAVEGRGQFIVGWEIQLAGCNPLKIYAFAYAPMEIELNADSQINLTQAIEAADINVTIDNDCDNPVHTTSCDDDPLSGEGENLAGE